LLSRHNPPRRLATLVATVAKRRGIYAPASTRWTDPRSQLLDGPAWAKVKDAVLTSLELPEEDPSDLLAGHAAALDEAYREVGDRLAAAGSDVTVDRDGRLHWPA
jgi:hypothetical protein